MNQHRVKHSEYVGGASQQVDVESVSTPMDVSDSNVSSDNSTDRSNSKDYDSRLARIYQSDNSTDRSNSKGYRKLNKVLKYVIVVFILICLVIIALRS
ncbi:MAG: hypothetical protein LUH03_03330 [Oscillospiraceae bacterium]|nr:hypothetical protein [Oscillospiraceae bacterium]